jgi:hypothetical protein
VIRPPAGVDPGGGPVAYAAAQTLPVSPTKLLNGQTIDGALERASPDQALLASKRAPDPSDIQLDPGKADALLKTEALQKAIFNSANLSSIAGRRAMWRPSWKRPALIPSCLPPKSGVR